MNIYLLPNVQSSVTLKCESYIVRTIFNYFSISIIKLKTKIAYKNQFFFLPPVVLNLFLCKGLLRHWTHPPNFTNFNCVHIKWKTNKQVKKNNWGCIYFRNIAILPRFELFARTSSVCDFFSSVTDLKYELPPLNGYFERIFFYHFFFLDTDSKLFCFSLLKQPRIKTLVS